MSIKLRLSLIYSGFFLIILSIFGISTYFFLTNNFIKDVDNTLFIQSTNLQKNISHWNWNSFNINTEILSQFKKLWMVVFINSKSNIDQSENSINEWFYYWVHKSQNYRFYKSNYNDYTIIIWKDLKDYNFMKRNLFFTLIILSIILITLSSVIIYFVIKQSLNPLYKLILIIKKINIEKDSFPIEDFTRDEIWLLAEQFDQFIWTIKENINDKQEFLENASHELRTPLMWIMTSLEFLENVNLPERKLKKIKAINDCSERMKNIVDGLLFIARWEKIINKQEVINVYELINNLTQNFNFMTKEKNIKINIIKNHELSVKVSKYHVNMLFNNLIKNAIIYNKKNWKINITINKDNIIIEDTWVWISKEWLEKVWDRFFRENNEQKWTWLWLSIVKKIIDMNKWSIDVSSELWKWTQFNIKF